MKKLYGLMIVCCMAVVVGMRWEPSALAASNNISCFTSNACQCDANQGDPIGDLTVGQGKTLVLDCANSVRIHNLNLSGGEILFYPWTQPTVQVLSKVTISNGGNLTLPEKQSMIVGSPDDDDSGIHFRGKGSVRIHGTLSLYGKGIVDDSDIASPQIIWVESASPAKLFFRSSTAGIVLDSPHTVKYVQLLDTWMAPQGAGVSSWQGIRLYGHEAPIVNLQRNQMFLANYGIRVASLDAALVLVNENKYIYIDSAISFYSCETSFVKLSKNEFTFAAKPTSWGISIKNTPSPITLDGNIISYGSNGIHCDNSTCFLKENEIGVKETAIRFSKGATGTISSNRITKSQVGIDATSIATSTIKTVVNRIEYNTIRTNHRGINVSGGSIVEYIGMNDIVYNGPATETDDRNGGGIYVVDSQLGDKNKGTSTPDVHSNYIYASGNGTAVHIENTGHSYKDFLPSGFWTMNYIESEKRLAFLAVGNVKWYQPPSFNVFNSQSGSRAISQYKGTFSSCSFLSTLDWGEKMNWWKGSLPTCAFSTNKPSIGSSIAGNMEVKAPQGALYMRNLHRNNYDFTDDGDRDGINDHGGSSPCNPSLAGYDPSTCQDNCPGIFNPDQANQSGGLNGDLCEARYASNGINGVYEAWMTSVDSGNFIRLLSNMPLHTQRIFMGTNYDPDSRWPIHTDDDNPADRVPNDLYSNFPFLTPQPGITKLWVHIFGNEMVADGYHEHAREHVFGMNGTTTGSSNTLVVVPNFKRVLNKPDPDLPRASVYSCSAEVAVPTDTRNQRVLENELFYYEDEEWKRGGSNTHVLHPYTNAAGRRRYNCDTYRISSFQLVDNLIEELVRFHTGIKEVIVSGHSAGGQFVQRYAATTHLHLPGGVSIKYIAANPSSYMYLDNRRALKDNSDDPCYYDDCTVDSSTSTGSCYPETVLDATAISFVNPLNSSNIGLYTDPNCIIYKDLWVPAGPMCDSNSIQDYNIYRYEGAFLPNLDDINNFYYIYFSTALRDLDYVNRKVIYLIGQHDNDIRTGGSLSTSCPAQLQGENRLTRGQIFYEYMKSRLGTRNHEIYILDKTKKDPSEAIPHIFERLLNTDIGSHLVMNVPLPVIQDATGKTFTPVSAPPPPCANGVLELSQISPPFNTSSDPTVVTTISNFADLEKWQESPTTSIRFTDDMVFAKNEEAIVTDCDVFIPARVKLSNLGGLSITARNIEIKGDIEAEGKIRLLARETIALRPASKISGEVTELTMEAPKVTDQGDSKTKVLYCAEANELEIKPASRDNGGGDVRILADQITIKGDFNDPLTVNIEAREDLSYMRPAKITGAMELAMKSSGTMDFRGDLVNSGNITLEADSFRMTNPAVIKNSGHISLSVTGDEAAEIKGDIKNNKDVEIYASSLILRRPAVIANNELVKIHVPGTYEQYGDIKGNDGLTITAGEYLIHRNADLDDNLGCSLSGIPLSGSATSPECEPPWTGCTDDTECPGFDPCTTGLCRNGTCYYVAKADGESCDDGSWCIHDRYCEMGICTGGIQRDCSAYGDQCSAAVCDEEYDLCYADPTILQGAYCDDGLFCTVDETCNDGICQGGIPNTCPMELPDCQSVVCNELTDTCDLETASLDGTPCDDQSGCTEGETCLQGECQGGTPRDCSHLSDDCHEGICDEAQAICVADAEVKNGEACEDGLFCNVGESCLDGVCVGGAALDCGTGRSCSEELDACVSTGGCQSDTECGLGQMCEGGQCVSYGCTFDANCPTDQVCLNHRCVVPFGSGSISGTVNVQEDYLAAQHIEVRVWEQYTGAYYVVSTAALDSLTHSVPYTVSGLPQGFYQAEAVLGLSQGDTTLLLKHHARTWSNLVSVDPANADQGHVTGVDFQLGFIQADTGSIEGRLLYSSSQQPILDSFGFDGGDQASDLTHRLLWSVADEPGMAHYRLFNLGYGQYTLQGEFRADEACNNSLYGTCEDCPEDGIAVDAASPSASGVDLTFHLGTARIEGTLTVAPEALNHSAVVSIWQGEPEAEGSVKMAATQLNLESGSTMSWCASGLPEGNVTLSASVELGPNDTIFEKYWNNPLTLVAGATQSGVDLYLGAANPHGGQVTGIVRTSVGVEPERIRVTALPNRYSLRPIATGWDSATPTGTANEYAFFLNLPVGNYWLYADSSNPSMTGYDPNSPILVSVGAMTSDVTILLGDQDPLLGKITGTIFVPQEHLNDMAAAVVWFYSDMPTEGGLPSNNPVGMGYVTSVDETLGALHYEVTNLPSDHYFAAAGVWACGGDYPTALQFYGEPPTELILDLSQGTREISGVDFTFSEGELVCP